MTLTPGARLSSYEILESIGAGGIEFLIHVKSLFEKISSLRV
jgi:hypothetical protein